MTTAVRFPTTLALATVILAIMMFDRAAAFEPDGPQPDADVADVQAPADSGDAPEVAPTDWATLDWHPAPVLTDSASSPWTIPMRSDPVTHWERTEHVDGSSAVTVKRTLQTGWDSNVGAEFNLAPHAEDTSGSDSSTGAAWASVSAPSTNWGTSTIDARLDAAQTSSKARISASNSMPLGQQLSLTLQSGYSAAESFAPSAIVTPADAASDSRFYTAEQVARLTILPTHTKVAAGVTMSTADDQWLRTLSAEQQLFDGASVTRSITKSADGLLSTSLLAKFQRRW